MDYSKIMTSLRRKMGWTLAETAAKLGISHVMVSQIQSGTRAPSVKMSRKILDLAAECGVPIPEDAPVSPVPSSSPSTAELFEIIKSQQETILSLARSNENMSKNTRP